MPGSRGRDERTVVVQLRLTEAEATLWRAHVEAGGGYLSGLIRTAVSEHLAFKKPGVRCPHWD